jgi:hypothetical protein
MNSWPANIVCLNPGNFAGSHRESLGLDQAATLKKAVELVRLNATYIYRLICNLKPSCRLK